MLALVRVCLFGRTAKKPILDKAEKSRKEDVH